MPTRFRIFFASVLWWFVFPLTWFPPAVVARPLLMLRGQKVQPTNEPTNPIPGSGKAEEKFCPWHPTVHGFNFV